MVVLNLPDDANSGDAGHIADHNLIVAALGDLNDGKAEVASPALTGTPTAPTPAAGDESARLATTAFVAGEFDGQRRVTHPNTDDVLVQVWDEGLGRWQTVHYDSGWRNIAGLAWTNINITRATIRRQGWLTSVKIYGTLTASTTTSPLTLVTLPSGFRPPDNDHSFPAINFLGRGLESTVVSGYVLVHSSGAVYLYGCTSGDAFTFVYTFPTYDAIPTSLPGTLASAAPA